MTAVLPELKQRPASGLAHVADDLLLMAETAAIFGLSGVQAAELRSALLAGDRVAAPVLARLGLEAPAAGIPPAPQIHPVRALALTVSQTCNLACGYCYAAGGSFGGADTRMGWDVAKRAIDQLIEATVPGGGVKIAFMGGEPMVARDLIRRSVTYANKRGATRAIQVGYSLTTNGTLISPKDAAFFARHRFAVTVSLDGGKEVNDRLRPDRAGKGSFKRVAQRLAPLLDHRDRISLGARVTVTPQNLDLSQVVDDIAALGFASVGVSPMISSPTGQGALAGQDFARLLAGMMACGDAWMSATLAGRAHPFANLATVLGELHRGSPRSHGCGAARDYLAVDAAGEYSACHRFVKDPLGAMGDLDNGPNDAARAAFLEARTVERQSPCQTCWARRLCGGGCHQEVLHAGRPACDFVRGWLDYGLRAYGRLNAVQPDWFDAQP
ncbi:SPASM domain-containing protein [Sulfitobacter sp. M57]|uniref:radical SAM/SPASM domain-containing protein n=1 Tax=unclassified Sulfitobacter TaxID=196795 RepID=UPI0023E14777|nr:MULTISPECIES: radical SAM protein [unclassified Sulfitobacter]MDF3415882.1 SPASM domain-containing protein [Sulfitobacter sp. KE5]MDF3423362.1 SPASM domain-containing protein [Sulfitobacter sp. KE43]MDF3434428.1 SPASM domain-containing protein [Sulfitobacter sp. KE42]MDF3460068.1 SPASM domain-containing protein [Sulfitobacter sp. S74]MDF3463966.1 SPASM domain-containing protein [Sulfitobacter sp. Ks18]